MLCRRPGLARQPQPLLAAWRRSTASWLDFAVHQPSLHPDTGASIHLVGIQHSEPASVNFVAAVLDRLRPDAIALELPREALTNTLLASAQRVHGTIDKLSQAAFQDPFDALHLVSDTEHTDWNEVAHTKLRRYSPLDSAERKAGALQLAKCLTAALWGARHDARLGGIDYGMYTLARQQSHKHLGPDDDDGLTGRERTEALLGLVGDELAQLWQCWAAECAEVTGQRDASNRLVGRFLLRLLSRQNLTALGEVQKRHNPRAFSEVIDKRDAHMAQRLRVVYGGRGCYACHQPARVIVAVVGSAHVAGIQRQLLMMGEPQPTASEHHL